MHVSARITDWVLNNRILSIALCLALVFAAGAGVHRLGIASDHRVYFEDDDPLRVAYDAIEDNYSTNDNLIIGIAPAGGSVFDRDTLTLLETMTERGWQVPYSSRVDSITNFQHSRSVGDDININDLFEDSANLQSDELEYAKQVALTDEILKNGLVSADGAATAINISINLPGQSKSREVKEIMTYVRAWLDEVRLENPDTDIRLTGRIALDSAFAEAGERDVSRLFTLEIAVILTILLVALRSGSAIGITLVTIVSSVFAAVGLLGWLRLSLTPDGISAAMMIMPIAVADCVHILTAYKQHLVNGSESRIEAMRQSLTINFKPVVLTSLTTILGFLSLNFSDSPPLGVIGNLVAIGVVFAFLLSLFFVPAVMTFLPAPVKQSRFINGAWMESIGNLVIGNQKMFVASIALFSAVCLYALNHNELTQTTTNFFSESMQFRQDTDWVDKNLTGITVIQVSLDSGSENGITKPDYLQALDNFTQWLRQQEHVVYVSSFSDIMKKLNKNMHNDAEELYTVPESAELASQYLLLYEMSLPLGLSLTNKVNIDKSTTRVSVALHKISTTQILNFDQAVANWIADNAAAQMTLISSTGADVMFSYLIKRNIISMFLGISVTMLVIALVLAYSMRSLRIGLISLVINFLPVAVAFGIWGYFVGEVGLILSVAMGMTIGIVVDDTVHFLHKFFDGMQRLALSAEDAIRYVFRTSGVAMALSSLALCAGFMVLVFSVFSPNADLGIMTAMIIALALVYDFLLLPVILLYMYNRPKVEDPAKTLATA